MIANTENVKLLSTVRDARIPLNANTDITKIEGPLSKVLSVENEYR